MSTPFPNHEEAVADVGAPPPQVFAFLDDHRRLSAHMESSSLMMAGSSMRVETDERHGQAAGSHIRLAGSVLGIRLSLDEVVTDYEPPRRKAWQTVGEPRLLVIGSYRMGFDIDGAGPAAACASGSTATCPPAASGAGSDARWAASMRSGAPSRCCTAAAKLSALDEPGGAHGHADPPPQPTSS